MADWTTPSAIHSKCGESTYQKAIYTIDENTGTYWQHPTTQYHWIIFDMGETKRITQVRLYSDGTYRFGRTTGLYVYVGDDPADLGDAVLEDIVDATGWWESGAFDKNGRYIKLLSKSNSADQLIYEFDAMAEAVGGVAHYKTVSEILGLVDGKSTKTAFHKTSSEVLGLVDDWDKNRCKKCKPSSVILTF